MAGYSVIDALRRMYAESQARAQQFNADAETQAQAAIQQRTPFPGGPAQQRMQDYVGDQMGIGGVIGGWGMPRKALTKRGEEISFRHEPAKDEWSSADLDAFIGGKPAGGVSYFERAADGTMTAPTVFVEPEFRRQGVATALYNRARELGGDLQVPKSAQSDEGLAFRRVYDAQHPAAPETQALIDALRNQRER
jgi:GNAT superfamily N-acetyltransferase